MESSTSASFRRSSALPSIPLTHGSWIITSEPSSITTVSHAQATTLAIEAARPTMCARMCAFEFLTPLAIASPATTEPPQLLISISASSPSFSECSQFATDFGPIHLPYSPS